MSPSEYPGENPPSGTAPRALIYPSLLSLLIRERRGLEESAPTKALCLSEEARTPEICTTGPFLGANLSAGLERLPDSCYHSASGWSPAMSAYRPPPNSACPCSYESDNYHYQTNAFSSCQCQGDSGGLDGFFRPDSWLFCTFAPGKGGSSRETRRYTSRNGNYQTIRKAPLRFPCVKTAFFLGNSPLSSSIL